MSNETCYKFNLTANNLSCDKHAAYKFKIAYSWGRSSYYPDAGLLCTRRLFL